MKNDLIEGLDYYINEKGMWVFTAHFLLKRNYCCRRGCLHCPYGYNSSILKQTDDKDCIIIKHENHK